MTFNKNRKHNNKNQKLFQEFSFKYSVNCLGRGCTFSLPAAAAAALEFHQQLDGSWTLEADRRDRQQKATPSSNTQKKKTNQTHRCVRGQRSSASPPILATLQQNKNMFFLLGSSVSSPFYLKQEVGFPSDWSHKWPLTFALMEVLLRLFEQTWKVDHHSIPWHEK